MKRISLILALAFSLPIAAQTLNDCYELAEANYPLAKRYGLIEQTAEYTVANIRKGWLPQVSLSAQATMQSDVMTFPESLQNMLKAKGSDYKGLRRDQYKVAIDVQQCIYDGGALAAKREVALQESEVAVAKTTADIFTLRERVGNLYFGCLLLKEKARLIDAQIELLGANLRKMENLLTDGVAMRSDVAAVRRELVQTKQQRTDIECSAEAFSKMLSLLCGKEITPQKVTENIIPQSGEEALGLTMAVFDAQKLLLTKKEKLLNAAIRPHLSLFVQGFYGYPGLNTFNDMFSNDWSLNGIVGVRLNWNFSSLYTHANDKRKLALQREDIDVAREVFTFNRNIQQTQEQQYIVRCQRLLAEDDEVIELSREVREAAEAKLDEGIIDTNTLLQEITHEQQALIRRVEHEIEMLQHIAELRYLEEK